MYQEAGTHMELLLPRTTQVWLAALYGGGNSVPQEAQTQLYRLLNQQKLVAAVTSGKLELYSDS